MNRFHLLSLEDEEDSAPAVPVASVSASTPVVHKKTAEEHKAGKVASASRMDRRSRGPRKGEGEKHQTVGKGSWGKAIDSNTTENVAEQVGEETEAGEAAQPREPKVVYKTVTEYLAEQATAQKRRELPAVRRANEGAEIDAEMEVVHKADQPSTPIKKISAKEQPSTKRMTLQELDKILPKGRDQPRQREERRDNRDREQRPRDGLRSDRKDNRSPRDAHEKGSRPDYKAKQPYSGTKTATVNLSDKSAFPALA
jgi:hypothetical protein